MVYIFQSMKNWLLLISITILFVNINQCFAAFPIKKEHIATNATEHVEKMSAALPAHRLQPEYNEKDKGGSNGLISAGLGGGGLLSFILGGALAGSGNTFGVALLVFGAVLGIFAIDFGAKGTGHKNRGWAIAGLVLGIIEVTVTIIGAIIALFILLYGGF